MENIVSWKHPYGWAMRGHGKACAPNRSPVHDWTGETAGRGSRGRHGRQGVEHRGLQSLHLGGAMPCGEGWGAGQKQQQGRSICVGWGAEQEERLLHKPTNHLTWLSGSILAAFSYASLASEYLCGGGRIIGEGRSTAGREGGASRGLKEVTGCKITGRGSYQGGHAVTHGTDTNSAATCALFSIPFILSPSLSRTT